MLLLIAGVLVILWLLGFLGHVGGGFIHLLLVLAIVVVVVQLLTNRHTV